MVASGVHHQCAVYPSIAIFSCRSCYRHCPGVFRCRPVILISMKLFVDSEVKSGEIQGNQQYIQTTQNMYIGGIPADYAVTNNEFNSVILDSLKGGSINDLTFDDDEPYDFAKNLGRNSVIFDGDDYSEPIPKDLIIRKPTTPTPPPPGPLGSTSKTEPDTTTTAVPSTSLKTTSSPSTTEESTTSAPTTTPEPVTTPPPTTTPEPVTTPRSTTTPEPVTTLAPTTALPMCPMPEQPAQLTGVMGFGLDVNSHAAYAMKKDTPIYKLIGASTRLIFDFRASNPNGIMLYTANPTQLDFIVCYLEDSKVGCSFCAGGGILKLISPKATYSDGNWHTVRLLRKGLNGTLNVDDKRVASGQATGTPRYINGLEMLFLGGVPEGFVSKRVPVGSQISFPGCIRNVTVNKVDIGEPTAPYKTQECYRDSPESGVNFENGGGYLKVAKAYTVGQTEEISLEIKPTSHTGLLLSTQNAKGDYLVLEMKLGNIIIRVENGGGELVAEFVAEDPLQNCDGKWHTIKAWKDKNVVRIQVDDNPVIEGEKKGAQTSADIYDPLYVGGAPDGEKAKGVTVTESYTGCMRNLVSKDPGQKPKKLPLAKPLMMTGNLYLGGCPYK